MRSGWLWLAAAVGMEVLLVAGASGAMWSQLNPSERTTVTQIILQNPGLPLLAAVAQALFLALLIHVIFRRYIAPIGAISEETRIIALSNAGHRLPLAGRSGVADLVEDINRLADRHQAARADVDTRVSEASAALEEERNTLAALISHLTQGVLVCNPEGRILLYNQRARALLEASATEGRPDDWIGLGRSVHSVLDRHQIDHAVSIIRHHLQRGEIGLMTPFVTSRPGNRLLNVHVMPVLDNDIDRNLRGYVLTLEDITRRLGAEARRTALLKALTEDQRSAIAGIRAAIETVLFYPEMDPERRYEFLEAIRNDALRVSGQLDRLEVEYGAGPRVHGTLDDTLGSNLLAAIERQVVEATGLALQISAPLEPLWLKADSYAIACCIGFLVAQLGDVCRAEHLKLTLQRAHSLACLVLEWQGSPLHMEALKFWGTNRNVLSAWRGQAATLFDVIEAHGGAIWAHPASTSGCPSLRLILPLSDEGVSPDEVHGGMPSNQAFDFELFRTPVALEDLGRSPLTKLSFTVIDTETTGLNPSEGDEIIAIGAVRVVNNRILYQEVFDCLINPRRFVGEAAQAVHGITTDMLRGMPTVEEALPRLQRFVEDTVIIGHNVAFDMRFFELKEDVTGIRLINPVLDTLILATLVHPQLEDISLEAIATRFGITVTGRHTALGDALTTAAVFLAMIPLLAERGIQTLDEAQAACARSRYAQIKY